MTVLLGNGSHLRSIVRMFRNSPPIFELGADLALLGCGMFGLVVKCSVLLLITASVDGELTKRERELICRSREAECKCW